MIELAQRCQIVEVLLHTLKSTQCLNTTVVYCYRVTATLRDYTKIEVENCQLITQYGGKKFQFPWDITTSADDNVFIVDRENNEVAMLNKDMKLIRTFGQGSGDKKISNPVGVAVGHETVAVSEKDNHAVKKFTLKGDYLSKFGCRGSEDGQFHNPQGLAFSSKGLLHVVDRSNCRVQVFGHNNIFLFKFGSKGSNPGQFQCPRFIALDSSDQVYVTVSGNNGGISMFSDHGQFIKKIIDKSSCAICLTPDGYIISNDHYDHFLTVFSPTHQLITKFGALGNQRGQFNDIHGIAVNSAGTIFVTEYNNRRLQIITT